MMRGIRKEALFFLAAFLVSGCDWAAAAEHSWKLRKSADGIRVFTREVENSPILELRGEVEVDIDLRRAVDLYEQANRMTEWFHRSKEVKLLDTISADEQIIYFAADLPWPLWDRDGVYRRVKSVDPVSQSVTYALRAEVDTYPRHKGRVRVNYLDGEWRFTPRSQERTAISYRMHTEAGGYIPVSVVNRFTVSLPFMTLFNFRALLQREYRSISAV